MRAMLATLVTDLERALAATVLADPTPLEDLSLRHLAKATGTTRAALGLLAAGAEADACILVRAVFEQLFAYLWVVQDPGKAEWRAAMVTLKQEWANAKYLEGLLPGAPLDARAALEAEAAGYRARAEALLASLASELGTTPKQVRDEATRRVSAKAIEVNLGPDFSVPYAYYSGFVHTDGNALAAYAAATPSGTGYRVRGPLPQALPVARDAHRALLRMACEVDARCCRLAWPDAASQLAAQAAWLRNADEQARSGR